MFISDYQNVSQDLLKTAVIVSKNTIVVIIGCILLIEIIKKKKLGKRYHQCKAMKGNIFTLLLKQVALSTDFLNLPKAEILEILSKDELDVTSEEQVNLKD